jgi:protein SCO1/2
MKFLAAITLCFLIAGAAPTVALAAQHKSQAPEQAQAKPTFDPDAAMAKSKAAAGNQIADIRLVDAAGRQVDLAEFQGKPLLVNMIYTSCAHFCGVLARNLIEAVSSANAILGKNAFTVVSVGFDAKVDTPDRMRQWGRSQGIDFPNWRLLAGDALAVRKLADVVGFTWAPSPIGFDHLAQVTIVDNKGRVAYQVYGTDFDPPILVEPLKRIALGERLSLAGIEGLVNRVRLFCTIYDPKFGRYVFDYSIFISIAIGVLVLGTVGTIVARAWLRERRHHPA